MIPDYLSHLETFGGLPMPKVIVRQRVGRMKLANCTWPNNNLMTLMTVWCGESGAPDFGKYDEELHRQCMHGHWCHVCGREDKHLLLSLPRVAQVQQRLVDGAPMKLIAQPWVCARCLAYACVTCPPLMATLAAGDGMVVSPRGWDLIAVLWQPVNANDPVPPPGMRVLSGFKVHVKEGAEQLLPDWFAGVGRKLLRRMKCS